MSSLEWWALSTTAKNFLSTNFGNQVFQLLLIKAIAEEGKYSPLYILNATPTQIDIARHSNKFADFTLIIKSKFQYWFKIKSFFKRIVKNTYHAVKITRYYACNKKEIKVASLDTLFMTYLDRKSVPGSDPFFGDLNKKIVSLEPELSTMTVCFLNTGEADFFKKKDKFLSNGCFALLEFLTVKSIFLIWMKSCFKTKFTSLGDKNIFLDEIDFSSLLSDSINDDVMSGRYFMNLAVYYSALQMFSEIRIKNFIYPFENKSIEKMMLLASKNTSLNANICSVGYQHTSITPRHTTLLFSEFEAENTPLPKKIITAGHIAREYLQANGNYPENYIFTGCALRQQFPSENKIELFNSDRTHVLLTLSSSLRELKKSIEFMRNLLKYTGKYEIGVRPHPEFSMSDLPITLKNWANKNLMDLSGSNLQENLKWCDVCMYVSSSVAIEAMMFGKPVINIRFDDVINPDPVINNPVAHWSYSKPNEVIDKLDWLRKMDKQKYNNLSEEAKKYALNYFVPATNEKYKIFYGR
jgi:hypothetical protein